MNPKQTTSKKQHAVIPRASAPPGTPYPWDDDDTYDDSWPPRLPNSAIRYQGYPNTTVGQPPVIYSRDGRRKYTIREAPPVTPQRQPHPNVNKATSSDVMYGNPASQRDIQARQDDDQPRRRVHWMLYVGFAMVLMLIGFVLITLLSNWWQVKQDDWNYGRPRTFQTDMAVGHGGDSPQHPSHFIAINLNAHVEIIEFAGGDPSKARMYIGPTLIGPGQDLAVVTLSFKDVNGSGKLAMIVNVENSHFVFVNDQGQFRPARPGERISM